MVDLKVSPEDEGFNPLIPTIKTRPTRVLDSSQYPVGLVMLLPFGFFRIAIGNRFFVHLIAVFVIGILPYRQTSESKSSIAR